MRQRNSFFWGGIAQRQTLNKFLRDKAFEETDQLIFVAEGYLLNKTVLFKKYGASSMADLVKQMLEHCGEAYFTEFRGCFSGAVYVKAENKWVDVRLEIADATGNYQKQTISPAFFVELSSGINHTVNASANAFVVIGKTVKLANGKSARFTVRSIDRRTLQSAYTNAIDINGMTAGMYIVTATADNGNVVSTKVAM